MSANFVVKRTTASDSDFKALVAALDTELWDELQEDQATYDQYNKVPDVQTAVVIYDKQVAVACGCFKVYNENTVEIKRMFVTKSYRGNGLSKIVLSALESWALEESYTFAILETSIHFTAAKKLYLSNGYNIIPNYGQYAGLEESVCMRKTL